MPDFVSPEPIRSMFDSEIAYGRAWMQWAESTPGGWRARMAERGQKPRPSRIPVEWIDKPESGGDRSGSSETPSPCCHTPVVIDPHPTPAPRGLCSRCGDLLDYVGSSWEAGGR
ncbi:MAG TPA: hypothetical protein VFN68_03340 [Acidimicrobiales bacterium]|nr:hypothetical protein [Acidimicrobiales bacterium]